MFHKIEADVPLFLPGREKPVNANVVIDSTWGTIKIESINQQAAAIELIDALAKADGIVALGLSIEEVK